MRAQDPLASEREVGEDASLDEVMGELEGAQGDQISDEIDDREALPREIARCDAVIAAMERILAGDAVDQDALAAATEPEEAALRALVTVVRGFTDDGKFVYAEDRLAELNSALALLQPVLSVGTLPGIDPLRDAYDRVVDQLDELRQELEQLGGAEEELAAAEAEAGEVSAVDDPDEEEEDKRRLKLFRRSKRKVPDAAPPGEAGPTRATTTPIGGPAVEGGERASTLYGEPAVERTERASALSGGPAIERAERPSTLYGEPAVERAERPSTLYDDAPSDMGGRR